MNRLNREQRSRLVTRLTNAFSKKIEKSRAQWRLHFMYYNFVRVRKTLRATPALAARVTKRLREICDLVDVLGTWEATPRMLRAQ